MNQNNAKNKALFKNSLKIFENEKELTKNVVGIGRISIGRHLVPIDRAKTSDVNSAIYVVKKCGGP